LKEEREKNQEREKENFNPLDIPTKGAACFPFSRMGILPPSRIRLSSGPPVANSVKRLFNPHGWPHLHSNPVRRVETLIEAKSAQPESAATIVRS
jgi:hypothetical protein